METVKERVDSIEEIMKQLSLAQLNTEKELTRLSKSLEESYQRTEEGYQRTEESHQKTDKELTRLSRSLEESHQRTEKELISLSQEMKDFKGEMKDFKNEMKDFKNEMKDFKNEMSKSVKSLNKKWGELANRMGTVVEDIVAPNISTIAQTYFKTEIEHLMIRTYKKSMDKTKDREFDVIAVCKDLVILNSTKTTPSKNYIDEYAEFIDSGELYDFFPELKSKTLIPVFSALSIREDLINYLTKLKIYALVMRGDNMDLANFDKIDL